MLDVSFSRMKTPPLFLGATLLFWGWQTDFLIPGAIMGVVLEGSRFTKTRWDLADEDFKRIWTFCALLFLAAAVYAFADNGGPTGLGHLFQGPTISAEHEAGAASARTAAELIRWVPMIFFLFIAAQAYSFKQEIPLHTISLILQRRWKQAKKLGKPLPATRGVDVSYPYFAICLFAASVHKNENRNYFWGLCVLLGWVLWVRRPRRFGPVLWLGALALAIAFGYTGARTMGIVQRYVDAFNVQLVADLFGHNRTDPYKSETEIGKIGRVETSTRILMHLKPESGIPPDYLREASYRMFRTPGTWTAGGRSRSDFTVIEHAISSENTWSLGLEKTNGSRIGIDCYLTERERTTGNPTGLLPLPTGSARLENLAAYVVKKNRFGAVSVEGPSFVQFDVVYGPGATFDGPPETNFMAFTNFPGFTNFAAFTNVAFTNANGQPSDPRPMFGRWRDRDPSSWGNRTNGDDFRGRGFGFGGNRFWAGDLQVPTNEMPALESIISELDLRNKDREETLTSIGEFFATKFTYRLWQDADNDPKKEQTPLARFLLRTHSGHCEYFATATVLLLRQLGIPARYAVGYSVHEAAQDGYLVRQRDAHAWCLVWNEKKNIWEDFDTTPGAWQELDSHVGGSTTWSDTWWWLKFQYSRLRLYWGQTRLRQYILIGLVPVLILLLIQIIRQRRRARADKNAGRNRTPWPGLDSEFYEIEKQLAQRGLVREPNETLAGWLERAAAEPSLIDLEDPLRALLRLHYRYRFDPNGLSQPDREELRRIARQCREKIAQTEKVA